MLKVLNALSQMWLQILLPIYKGGITVEMQKSKVYVLPDSSGYITRIDGGYTVSNITDP